MANMIEAAKVMNTELDKQMTPLLCTGWMDANAGLVKYDGGAEVKIPSISMSGLGNYDKDTGYPQGSVTLQYQTLTMAMDRANSFNLDAREVNESNFVATAGNVMGEFQRSMVVPEVDAYRISRINTLAGSRFREYTPAKASIFGAIQDDIAYVQNIVGEKEPLIIMMGTLVSGLLNQADELKRNLDSTMFESGGVKTKVRAINESPILNVPGARIKSAYTFYDGGAQFGFAPTAGAVDINWIIIHSRAPIAVAKTDVTRVFDPMTWQKSNAWHVDYRKFHDLWIKTNSLDGVFVNRKAAA